MRLKVLSWNIWIDGYFDQIVDFLKNSNADIIGLQEVQADDSERDVIGYLTKLGYDHIFTPVPKTGRRKVNDGPAVFSRHGILKSESYTLSETNSRMAVSADVQVGSETLRIFSTHLLHTHQERSDVQDEQIENLINLLPHERAIVMGDFNATPDSEVIINMRSILKDSDPASPPTWSMYPEGCDVCNPQSLDIRLDYIFTTSDLKTHAPKVENSKGSDHLPISVEIEV